MNNNLKSLCEKLNIAYNPEADKYYDEGIELYFEKGMFILDKERITDYNNRYNIFRRWFDDILKAADEVKKDEDLVKYLYILIALIKDNGNVALLPTPDRERLDTDYAPMFAVLYFLEDMISNMQKRNLPHDVISDTLNGLESECNDYFDILGRGGIRTCVSWLMLFVRGEILKIGRLQYQIKKFDNKIKVYQKDDDIKILIDGDYVHQKGMLFGSKGQTDEEGKYFADITEENGIIRGFTVNKRGECIPRPIEIEGYAPVLCRGDYVLNVHITSHESFTREECDASYERAKDIFRNCYSEYDFKAFTCLSWLLETTLKDIMGRETNITRFADRYIIYPILSYATSVYSILFNLPGAEPPESLPENTSMQRAVKQYLSDGNYFYEKGGIILL